MRTGKSLLLVVLLVCGLVPMASAQSVISKITGQELGQIMQSEGYAHELDSDGDVVWKIEGFRTLLLISADNDSIQFRAAFGDADSSLSKVNAWNHSKRYSRSYLDEADDPVLDLDLVGGVTDARIRDYLKTCRISFVAWVQEVVR